MREDKSLNFDSGGKMAESQIKIEQDLKKEVSNEEEKESKTMVDNSHQITTKDIGSKNSRSSSNNERKEEVSEIVHDNAQPKQFLSQFDLLPKWKNVIRGSSAPTKGMYPIHFRHGFRNHKHCIVCEGFVKNGVPPTSGQVNAVGVGIGGTASNNQNIQKNSKDGKILLADDQASDRKNTLLKEDSMHYQAQAAEYQSTYSSKPAFSIDGGNSEKGHAASPRHSFKGGKDLKKKGSAIAEKEGQINKAESDSVNLHQANSITQQDQIAPPSQYNKTIPDQSEKQEPQQEKESLSKNPSSSSPTKRDGDIDEFQRRRIRLDDFLQGQPTLKLMFSKHVRKFNRELLKATCLVIGCKRIYANKIAEKIFDEFDLILNSLSDNIDFEDHFDLNKESEDHQEVKSKHHPNTAGKKQITTITVSAPLFKYILKKYLVEKYKYSRPEYLKDFYVASDLVQSKRNILILLAGTSGTGKSTLASLLGSRLGISTVLSTDTIRHVMRNFMSKDDDPIIFASTYETAAFVSEDIQSKKKRTLLGYKDQCQKVQNELEKVIDDYQRRNESLVVEGVHLTVRFILNLMKKYPSCIPFVICITNEEKHKERFAVRTKHMTIDPRFNKYIKNVGSIRIIQKYLIKKAEAALIPRIDNSNIDKSIGLIHATIVRCLRQIAEGTPIFDAQRKQAMIMHQEFANISKNKLSSKDAQKFIHQKVNKHEILELYMKQQANVELEDKLKRYKRGQSMGELQTEKNRKKKENSDGTQYPVFLNAEGNPISLGSSHEGTGHLSINLNAPQVSSAAQNDFDGCNDEQSPHGKTVHVIMRPGTEGGEQIKLSEQERKNIKRDLLNVFHDFPEDEEQFGDSKAAQLAASSLKQTIPKPKKDKKEKVFDSEEQRIRDEKKRQSDQQKKIEEEKIQTAIMEAQKKEKEEQEKKEAEDKEKQEKERLEKEKQAAEEAEKERQQQRIEQQLLAAPKSQSLTIFASSSPSNEPGEEPQRMLNKSFEYLGEEEEESFENGSPRKRPDSKENKASSLPQNSSSSQGPINITNVKSKMKKEGSPNHPAQIPITIIESNEVSEVVKETPFMINQSPSGAQEGGEQRHNYRSLSSFEKLNKLEIIKDIDSSRNQQEVTSDMADDGRNNDEDEENLRTINVQSTGLLSNGKKDLLDQSHSSDAFASESNANIQINPSKTVNQTSKFKKIRDKEDVKSVEPPIQLSEHPGLIVRGCQNKSTERSAGKDGSSEGNSQEATSTKKSKGGLGSAAMLLERKLVGGHLGASNSLLRLSKQERGLHSSRAKHGKVKTQGSLTLATKKLRMKTGTLGLLGSSQRSLGQHGGTPQGEPHSQVLHTSTGGVAKEVIKPESGGIEMKDQSHATVPTSKVLKLGDQLHPLNEDTQSVYSGGSGLAPSLVSQSINFFPQGNAARTDEDNHSAALGGEKLHDSGESSDDTNSQDVEASDRGAISEEEDVSYSQSSDSDHEEEHEDEIEKKQTSFNQQKASAQPKQTSPSVQLVGGGGALQQTDGIQASPGAFPSNNTTMSPPSKQNNSQVIVQTGDPTQNTTTAFITAQNFDNQDCAAAQDQQPKLGSMESHGVDDKKTAAVKTDDTKEQRKDVISTKEEEVDNASR